MGASHSAHIRRTPEGEKPNAEVDPPSALLFSNSGSNGVTRLVNLVKVRERGGGVYLPSKESDGRTLHRDVLQKAQSQTLERRLLAKMYKIHKTVHTNDCSWMCEANRKFDLLK